MDDFGHGWGMVWGWILGLIILIILIWLIIRSLGPGLPRAGSGKKSALDILKDRYARGKISKEEYEDKKKDLM